MKTSALTAFSLLKNLKHFFFFPLLLILVAVTAFSFPPGKHIGTWKGTDSNDKIGTLVLDSSGYATMTIDNETFGGMDFEMKGDRAECKYEIDYSKTPIWLDMVMYNKENHQEMRRLNGIVKFITDNKIIYRISFGGGRYDKFDPNDKDDTIVLERVTN